jgi:hypothetical protein
VSFTNVTATGDHGVVLYADEGSAIEDVTFDNVRVRLRPTQLQESFGGNFDLRPFWDPARKVFAHDVPALFARGVKALALRNVTVSWAEALPGFCRHAFEIEKFEDVTIDGFRGRQAHERDLHTAAIVLREGRGAVVRNAALTRGGGRLLEAQHVEELYEEK